MKIIKITCDECKNKLKESNGFIELGSVNDSELTFSNTLKDVNRSIISLERYRALHFCNKDCFMGYFFIKK